MTPTTKLIAAMNLIPVKSQSKKTTQYIAIIATSGRVIYHTGTCNTREEAVEKGRNAMEQHKDNYYLENYLLYTEDLIVD